MVLAGQEDGPVAPVNSPCPTSKLRSALSFPPHSALCLPRCLVLSACCIHLVLAALSVPHLRVVMCPRQRSARVKSVSFPCPRSPGLLSGVTRRGRRGSLPNCIATSALASEWWGHCWRDMPALQPAGWGPGGTCRAVAGHAAFSLCRHHHGWLLPLALRGISQGRCHLLG